MYRCRSWPAGRPGAEGGRGKPVDDNGARDVPQKNQETLVEPELEQLFERVSGYFSLLSEPTRLKILNTLCDGERSVGDIVERTGASQTNVSRNLNLMYGRGVLRRRREGAMTFYAIADETVVHLCRTVCVQVASQADDHTVNARTLRRFMPQS